MTEELLYEWKVRATGSRMRVIKRSSGEIVVECLEHSTEQVHTKKSHAITAGKRAAEWCEGCGSSAGEVSSPPSPAAPVAAEPPNAWLARTRGDTGLLCWDVIDVATKERVHRSESLAEIGDWCREHGYRFDRIVDTKGWDDVDATGPELD